MKGRRSLNPAGRTAERGQRAVDRGRGISPALVRLVLQPLDKAERDAPGPVVDGVGPHRLGEVAEEELEVPLLRVESRLGGTGHLGVAVGDEPADQAGTGLGRGERAGLLGDDQLGYDLVGHHVDSRLLKAGTEGTVVADSRMI